jgi:mono/diheme cytochrome c family protein
MRRLKHGDMISGVGIFAALAVYMVSNTVLAETESSIMRGGELYDKWYKVIDVDAPKESHPLYPKAGKYADKAKANWRCKECHGWDYKGKDGAYSSGKHHSGIKGIQGMKGAAPDKVIQLLKDSKHGYGDKLSAGDLQDLAMFVTQGQIDMDKYIDASTKAPKGDKTKGAAYYNTICAKCHGKDGKLPKEMKPFGKQMGNPWEVMHKILNGQPAEKMPALRTLDHQIAADIMAHMTTLPKE